MGCHKNSAYREMYSIKDIYQQRINCEIKKKDKTNPELLTQNLKEEQLKPRAEEKK